MNIETLKNLQSMILSINSDHFDTHELHTTLKRSTLLYQAGMRFQEFHNSHAGQFTVLNFSDDNSPFWIPNEIGMAKMFDISEDQANFIFDSKTYETERPFQYIRSEMIARIEAILMTATN